MPKIKRITTDQPKKQAPAKTPEARENQLTALAFDLVEKRLREGTASSQETTHFLKVGSIRERLEKEKLMKENSLLEAKTKSLQSSERLEELMKDALKAVRTYSGQQSASDDDNELDN